MGILRYGFAVGLCLLFLPFNIAAVTVAEPLSLSEALTGLPDCAVPCVTSAGGNSSCELSDINCICANKQVDIDITTCVTASCPVMDRITTKNVTSRLCSIPIDVDDEIVPIFAVFISITLVAVALRILARVLTKAYFWWDDLCNLFALVGCIAFTAINIQEVEYGLGMDIWWVPHKNTTSVLKMFYVDMLLYTVTRLFVRASIILFYLRVFPKRTDSKLRPIIWWTMGANVVYNLGFLLAVIFQCTPIEHFWTQWQGLPNGKCINVNILAWAAAISGILFDVWLLGLPFPQLWALNVHWKKKFMGAMMFSVGTSVLIISLVRLKSINEFTRTVNPTRDIVQVSIWSGIEIDVGVICPCLPSFRLLIRKVWPRLVGTSSGQKYEMNSRYCSTAGVRSPSTMKNSSKKGNSTNIIKTTEVGVEFEPARPRNTSMASVTAPGDSDLESLNGSKNTSRSFA